MSLRLASLFLRVPLPVSCSDCQHRNAPLSCNACNHHCCNCPLRHKAQDSANASQPKTRHCLLPFHLLLVLPADAMPYIWCNVSRICRLSQQLTPASQLQPMRGLPTLGQCRVMWDYSRHAVQRVCDCPRLRGAHTQPADRAAVPLAGHFGCIRQFHLHCWTICCPAEA